MNLCEGDYVEWDAPQFRRGSFFKGSYRGGAKCTGSKKLAGIITRDSYGKTGQHTFTIMLTDGSKKRVKGRNLYPYVARCVEGPDHEAFALDKKLRKLQLQGV